MAEQVQYDCQHCKKAFRGNDGVQRIRCPHCKQTNIVMIPDLPNYCRKSVPSFSLPEAKEEALKLIKEYTTPENGWEEVAGATNYEGVASCHSRVYCVNDNYDEIFVSKATSHQVDCSIQQVMGVFWDLDAEIKVWNNSTLKSASILESSNSNTEQLVYQERKVHASISMGGDVVLRRAYDAIENDYFFSWATSVPSPLKPVQKNLRRCFLLVSGFYAKALSPTSCTISSVASYYETGNVPTVAITEECKRVALRICRIVKRIQEVVRISNLAPPTAAKFSQGNQVSSSTSKNCPKCGSPDSGGRFCSSCGSQLR